MPETNRIEYKQQLTDSLEKEVVAFLNYREGGLIYIGINNDGLPDCLSKDEFFEGFSVPRNKEVMRIFKDLDLVEKLGSGIPRILESYPKECFKFSDNFLRMMFPSTDQVNDQVSDQVVVDKSLNMLIMSFLDRVKMPKYPNEKQIEKYIILFDKLTNEQIKLLVFASTPKSNSELQEDGLGLQKHTDNFKKYINPLLVNSALERTFPDSPNSPSQKYFTSNKGKIMLYILSVKFKN